MNFRDRINAVLHRQKPDQVPLAPYDNLAPRGDFSREMRNRGMGLCLRRPWVWPETPNVQIETTTQGDLTTTTYHTPVGSLWTRQRTHVSRKYGGGSRGMQVDGLIKGVADLDPVIFMIEDTVYHVDSGPYYDAVRDVGQDGIVRMSGVEAPYDEAIELFGYSTGEGMVNWSYMMQDHPNAFARLLDALERRAERRIPLILDAPAEFVSFGSLDGFYGPRQWREQVLPFYQKVVDLCHARGKICSLHAHASALKPFVGLIRETGIDVIEAFTPPPVGDLSVAEARAAWGDETIIWVNFPETIFYRGPEATRQYTIDLLRSDRPGGALVIGFTETGLACIVDDEVERTFKTGFSAVMEAIEEYGNYPIR